MARLETLHPTNALSSIFARRIAMLAPLTPVMRHRSFQPQCKCGATVAGSRALPRVPPTCRRTWSLAGPGRAKLLATASRPGTAGPGRAVTRHRARLDFPARPGDRIPGAAEPRGRGGTAGPPTRGPTLGPDRSASSLLSLRSSGRVRRRLARACSRPQRRVSGPR